MPQSFSGSPIWPLDATKTQIPEFLHSSNLWFERFSFLWKILFLWQVQTDWKDEEQSYSESLIDRSAHQFFDLSITRKVPCFRLKSLSLPWRFTVLTSHQLEVIVPLGKKLSPQKLTNSIKKYSCCGFLHVPIFWGYKSVGLLAYLSKLRTTKIIGPKIGKVSNEWFCWKTNPNWKIVSVQ